MRLSNNHAVSTFARCVFCGLVCGLFNNSVAVMKTGNMLCSSAAATAKAEEPEEALVCWPCGAFSKKKKTP